MRSFAGIVTSVTLPLLMVALLVARPVHAQESPLSAAVRSSISPERLDAHAKVITSYERPSGSTGENAAIDYVVEALRAAGVPVEVHEFMGYTSNPVSASVTVPGSDWNPDAITLAFSGATDGVEGPVLDMGTLNDLPELEIGTGELLLLRDASTFSNVRGKVVIVTGQPRNIPTLALQELGAVAAIFINPEERLNDLIVTSTWGTPSLMSEHRLPTLPVAQIKKSDGDRLRAMMESGPATVRVSTEVDTGWKPLRLPVARVMPTDADDSTPYVLLGGHIDGWYHGGTDEGASNAAMVEMTIQFHKRRDQMRRGLVVAWWPGHSNGRYAGSTWFSDTFYDELRTRGLVYMNIDGVGQIDSDRFGASVSPALSALAVETVQRLGGQEIRPGRPGRNSDQAFNGVGLPLLQFNHSRPNAMGGYWWWHTPDDTYDKIDFDILKADTELYVSAISEFVAGPTLPISIEDELSALMDALAQREEASGGALDLSEALGRASDLAGMLAGREIRTGERAARAQEHEALLNILRPIHRIMFVPGSDHHPDPGIYGRPLPGLEAAAVLAQSEPDSDRYRFAMAQLLRERNRILEALDEATHAAIDMFQGRPRS
jgi:N-acetylated-alpha-linked acidic dipeptidase